MAAAADNVRQQASIRLCCFEERLAMYRVLKLDG